MLLSAETTQRERERVTHRIDFEKLKEELSGSIIEGKERYQFTWPDKSKSSALAYEKTKNTFRPHREESVNFDTTENLYIESDNLEALKLLQKSYQNKIKMIYIDPPYNTGNDFVYNDNFSKSEKEYEKQAYEYDEDGNLITTKTKSEQNGRFHTDWLNMMFPRLKLARELLTEDGVIFISIDDNEQANLKKICDEVFGERNFLYELSVVNNLNGNDNSSGMMETQEYCLIYSKNKDTSCIGVLSLDEEEKTDWKQDELGYWKEGRCLKATGINAPREARPNLFFPIFINEKTLEFTVEEEAGHDWYRLLPLTDGKEMSWYWSKETFKRDHNEVILKKTADGYSLYKKQRPSLGDLPCKRGKTTFYSPKYANANSNAEIKSIFNGKKLFEYSKSVALIKDLICLSNATGNDIILDFFSGSATTAHAVMKLNAEDGGNRKFIMVQLPEKCDEKSEAYKAGYKNICEIGKERIRRAGKQILEENKDKDLFSNDKHLDVGFRVLKWDYSNMTKVFYEPSDVSRDLLDSTIDNIKADRTSEDLIFQVLLDLGIELSAKIEKKSILGKEAIFVNGNFLIGCFDDDLDEDFFREVAKLKPIIVAVKSINFADDNIATNFEQIFNTLSPDTVRKVL